MPLGSSLSPNSSLSLSLSLSLSPNRNHWQQFARSRIGGIRCGRTRAVCICIDL